MLRLSACVIVKNEEENLHRWLICMKKIAYEMIVVDTGSTDRTVEVAETAGAKVYQFAWDDDFSAAKNFALSKATGDWILFLDADEYFTEETIDNLPQYLEKMHKREDIDAFFCRLTNVEPEDNNRFISSVQSLRIFRNSKKLQYRGAVHEFLVRSDGPMRIMKLEADVEIYHTGYARKIVRGKLERNLGLLLQDIAQRGEKPWHYGYLADCYFGLGDYEKAAKYAERSIEKRVVAMGQESMIYRRLIDSLALAGKEKIEVMRAIQIAIAKFPQKPEFIWNKGELLFSQKRYDEAEKCLQKALHLHKHYTGIEDSGTFEGRINLVYCTLGKIAVLKNDVLQALDYYTESLKLYRYNRFALQGLYSLLRSQSPADVIALLQALYDDAVSDFKFITETLRVYKWDKVYLYYGQLLKKKSNVNGNDLAVAGFFHKEKYYQAAVYAMEEIKDACEFMVRGINKEYEPQHDQVAQMLLPKSYRQVLGKCLGERVELSSDEQTIYDKINGNSKQEENDKQIHLNGVGEEVGENEHLTSIIIPVCNHQIHTQQCIESIRAFTQNMQYEIIVIDDGSTDGTAEWLRQQADVRVIFNLQPMGCVHALNQGIEEAAGDEILLLHNDTVLSAEWLPRLRLALYSGEKVGAVGPVSYGAADEQKPGFVEEYADISQMQAIAEKIANNEKGKHKQVFLLASFCLLLKKEAVKACGLFDEDFSPHYYEDTDYSLRLIKAGYQLLLAQDVFVHHTNNVTFSALKSELSPLFVGHHEKFKEKWGFSPHYSCGIRQDLLSLLDLEKENLTVLDVGCACGGDLMRIQEEHPTANLYGVELNEGAAEIAACFGSIANCNVEKAESLTWQVKFDYIIMGDILEHLNDPLQTLKNLRAFLKKDGCIVASIPNVMHISVIEDLLGGNWEYKDAGILDRTHLRFFTKIEIEKMIAAAALELITIRYRTVAITPKQEELKKDLSRIASVTNDVAQFDAYQWFVLAKNTIGVEESRQEEIRTELICNLQRLEDENSAVVAEDKIIQLFAEANEVLPHAYGWIDASFGEAKVKPLIDLAALLYRKGNIEASLHLIGEAYEKNQADADLIYAAAFLFHLHGDDGMAREILEKVADITAEMNNLLVEMNDENAR